MDSIRDNCLKKQEMGMEFILIQMEQCTYYI